MLRTNPIWTILLIWKRILTATHNPVLNPTQEAIDNYWLHLLCFVHSEVILITFTKDYPAQCSSPPKYPCQILTQSVKNIPLWMNTKNTRDEMGISSNAVNNWNIISEAFFKKKNEASMPTHRPQISDKQIYLDWPCICGNWLQYGGGFIPRRNGSFRKPIIKMLILRI